MELCQSMQEFSRPPVKALNAAHRILQIVKSKGIIAIKMRLPIGTHRLFDWFEKKKLSKNRIGLCIQKWISIATQIPDSNGCIKYAVSLACVKKRVIYKKRIENILCVSFVKNIE